MATASGQRLFDFPNPVNETSARLVAAGVVGMCLAASIGDQHWLFPVIAYGFIARVLTGPTLSPLGQVVTRVITPRLAVSHRYVPGPPKRFAQGIGAALSLAALIAHGAFGASAVAELLVVAIAAAAFLETVFALCLGCVVFGWLMRVGVVPDSVCVECSDISARLERAY